jgi:hypothetical protein
MPYIAVLMSPGKLGHAVAPYMSRSTHFIYIDCKYIAATAHTCYAHALTVVHNAYLECASAALAAALLVAVSEPSASLQYASNGSTNDCCNPLIHMSCACAISRSSLPNLARTGVNSPARGSSHALPC